MKIPVRLLVAVVSLLAVLGGGTQAWQAWRHARLDLVTLHVRNEPLRSVVGRMERQTRETIALDARLDARVSLDLDGVPLADALQEVAEQSGGLARATFAVFEKPPALDRLAALIRVGTPPETAGWTLLTRNLPRPVPGGEGPGLAELPEEVREALARGEKQVRVFRGGGGEGVEAGPPPAPAEAGQRVVEVLEDVVRGGPEAGAGGRPGGGAGMPSSATRRVVIRAGGEPGGGGGEIREYDLSPERLLLEAKLAPALAGETVVADHAAPGVSAPGIARRVKGQWARLFTLEKSPVPHLPGMRSLTWSMSGTAPKPGMSPADAAAEEMRRGQYDRIHRLTPEQRARAAGEAAAADAAR